MNNRIITISREFGSASGLFHNPTAEVFSFRLHFEDLRYTILVYILTNIYTH